MQKDKKYYDDFYKTHSVDVHNNPNRFNLVSSLLRGKVLDVACGTGTLADYYSGPYVGCDVSTVAISNARSIRRKDALFFELDFTKEFKPSGQKFDSSYLGEFLEHINDDKIVFENLKRCLHPTGRIVVSVPNGDRVPDESHCRIFTVPQIRRDYSKYGKITFQNFPGFEKRIVFTIDFGAQNENLMSLVMIAKDEAKGIERAILSALPLVDQVIVSVDTATTDKTAEIAKLYADELKFHKWEDDFSKARNYAQENVKTKWILMLDGHEYIEKVGKIEEKLKLDVDGIMITVKMENGLTFLFPRIYRKEIKFTGAVHNLNECKTNQFEPKFVIVHDRLTGQDEEAIKRRNEQRDKMLPKIMKERIQKNPKDCRALFHLGNYYMMIQQWKEAIKYFKQHLKYSQSNEEKYLMALNKGICHQMIGQAHRALWSFFRADSFLPGRWETYRMIGGVYYMAESWKKASDALVESMTPHSRNYLYKPFPMDLSSTWDLLGTCFVNLNQKKKALISYNRALEHTDDKIRRQFLETKIKFAKML